MTNRDEVSQHSELVVFFSRWFLVKWFIHRTSREPLDIIVTERHKQCLGIVGAFVIPQFGGRKCPISFSPVMVPKPFVIPEI